MESARLRKAFRYPDDSGDDIAREELDEEEQERVIKNLKIQNEERDSQYSVVFAAIPLLSIIVFVPSLLSSHALGVFTRFLSLISIISLLATTYTIKYVPPQRPDPKGKRPVRHPDLVRRYIIPGNSGISAFLVLVYFTSSEASIGAQPVVYLVPVALLTTILIVRHVMVSVDLKPLEDLRYEYKGA
ncbi:hypothetical protein ASPVEDRAFT_759274 [Aspergillus versicolor CBS 583.65]|uniref:Uncharacterized protein n=1 Tax=Aspergillus versicolor CBS 583.65 TaxID=1036611 RepID=A0A1L9PQP3_ASPVE|nr:uncharacterized protein ASPVEDRAFT_759274 [Aspergillus versicolor CBS 583.65]OJJ03821.1 hypothetical protein ASPVEDRAFT_759274 [Aspergillus versicolor CBS 583.65]